MVRSNINKQINQKLQKYYKEKNDEFVALHNKYFTGDVDNSGQLPRINEFGIIDEELYDADNGILIVGKETNGWDDEDFDAGNLFRPCMHEISRGGREEMRKNKHMRKHPNMWYNIGRWILYCEQIRSDNNLNYDCFVDKKDEAVRAIGKCAFTNVNKGRGYEVSGKEFWNSAQQNDLPKQMIKEEINIIEPKIVIFCGNGCLFYDLIENDKNRKYIDLCHPGARKATSYFLEAIKNEFTK